MYSVLLDIFLFFLRCECGKSFGLIRSLTRHRKFCPSAGEEETRERKATKETCSICRKSFSRKDVMRRHQKEKHAQVERKYKCGKCKKMFTMEPDLRRHVKFCKLPGKNYSGRRRLTVKIKKSIIRMLERENLSEKVIEDRGGTEVQHKKE